MGCLGEVAGEKVRGGCSTDNKLEIDDRCGGPIARGEVNTAATSAVRVRVPDTSKHPPHSRRVVVSLLPLSYRVL
jgi:hypothetical protein